MNDSERNGIVLRIAAKIQQDGTPYDEQNQSVLEPVSYTHLTLPTTPYV